MKEVKNQMKPTVSVSPRVLTVDGAIGDRRRKTAAQADGETVLAKDRAASGAARAATPPAEPARDDSTMFAVFFISAARTWLSTVQSAAHTDAESVSENHRAEKSARCAQPAEPANYEFDLIEVN